MQVASEIIGRGGLRSFFGRGLATKIGINGIQSAVFTVAWKLGQAALMPGDEDGGPGGPGGDLEASGDRGRVDGAEDEVRAAPADARRTPPEGALPAWDYVVAAAPVLQPGSPLTMTASVTDVWREETRRTARRRFGEPPPCNIPDVSAPPMTSVATRFPWQ